MDNLPKCGANYTPLSPIPFLRRAAVAYADRTSIIYGQNTRFTWHQTYDRCLRLASYLHYLNISKNDVVSVLAPNVPAMYEMHFAVPMAGAVLNTINTRLDAGGVAAILRHSEAKLLFVDYEYVSLAVNAVALLAEGGHPLPLVVVIDDVDAPTGVRLGQLEYEELIAAGDPTFSPHSLDDEWDSIALNYTSGTTSSSPKGVVYSHRGAYVSTVNLLLHWGVSAFPVYLWSLPMFHCNGWTFTWGVAARGGTNVCIRNTRADDMHAAISAHGVTHMCCAPTVFNVLLPEGGKRLDRRVKVLTGGAPPPAALLRRAEVAGMEVTHAYGLTEGTGPALVCEWWPEWDLVGEERRAGLKARQGVGVLSLSDVEVRNGGTLERVPRDGKTMGEIVMRGSSVMKGYLKNEEETRKAFVGDGTWLATGDVGVVHPDGYVEIKDRSKDVIISGGENVSSVEVEGVLYGNGKVVEAAVVAMPHPYWGETPCAFVAVREAATEEELLDYCRQLMPKFMVPKKVVFLDELPKTSTGKILKFKLREIARGFSGDKKEEKKSRCNDVKARPRKVQTEKVVVALSRL